MNILIKKHSELGIRIAKAIVGVAKKKRNEFAELLGVPASNLSRWINGTVAPSYEYIIKIGNLSGVSLEWLLTGKGPMERESFEIAANLAIYNDKEFVFIPQVTGEISAGGGLIADDTIEMRIAFRREWIEKKGDHHNMSLIRVSGDSMEPTLLSGDLVLIDHNRNFVDPQGGIYAISMDSIIMIKRLQVIYHQNRMKVISDNARYEAMDIDPGQVKVNGKVIWYGRELER
jgi:phage repressor protein C with HTH and peptisase S24 domain